VNEERDCRACEYLEFVDEEFPSSQEPVLVHKYYRCRKTGELFFALKELKERYRSCLFRVERAKRGLASEFEDEVRMINVIFTQLLGEKRIVEVMRIDTKIVAELATPCFTEKDFFVKVGYMYNVLDVNVSALRRLVTRYDKNWKGIKLVEQFLEERELLDEVRDVIEFWRDIIRLRDWSYPYHRRRDEKILEVMNRLGLKYPPIKWKKLYSSLFQRFVSSLRRFRKALLRVLK